MNRHNAVLQGLAMVLLANEASAQPEEVQHAPPEKAAVLSVDWEPIESWVQYITVFENGEVWASELPFTPTLRQPIGGKCMLLFTSFDGNGVVVKTVKEGRFPAVARRPFGIKIEGPVMATDEAHLVEQLMKMGVLTVKGLARVLNQKDYKPRPKIEVKWNELDGWINYVTVCSNGLVWGSEEPLGDKPATKSDHCVQLETGPVVVCWEGRLCIERPEKFRPTKPTIPWDAIDQKFRFAASDSNGYVWVYSSAPVKEDKRWYVPSASAWQMQRIDGLFAGVDPGTVGWEHSLSLRPESNGEGNE